jgi:hypothetical protein
MMNSVDAAKSETAGAAASVPADSGGLSPISPMHIWERIKHHKVMHWTLAYAAAAYTLLHGVEMVSDALSWRY